MKKIKGIDLKILTSLLILSTITLSAGTPFIGVDYGTNTIRDKHDGEKTGKTVSLKFGSQNGNYKAGFGYKNFITEDNSIEEHKFYVLADYIFTSEDSLLRPYAGIVVGFASIDYSGYKTENSLNYGVNGGLILNVMENIDIDLGVEYSFYYMDNTIMNVTGQPIYYYDEPFKDNINIKLGLNYKF